MKSAARVSAFGLLLALTCLGWTQSGFAQNPPKKYEKLYRELDAQLSEFHRRLPARASGKAAIRAASLLSVDCQRGEFILSEAQREATLRELDALQELGAEGIVLQVCYPLLTPAFRDPLPFIEYYANLANAIHVRGMKVVVEHNSLLPAYASVDVRPYYGKLTKQRFVAERFAELKAILLGMNPDYLTLVSDPRGQTAGLKLTVSDWRSYVQRSVDALSGELGSFPTLLGAGSGLWDDFDYVQAFAGIKGLSYIDLHLYPLATAGQSNLERLLAWPDRIRAIDGSKRIIASELWLYKAGPEERFDPVADPNVTARDVFGFWAPLDRKFLQVAGIAAREKGIELVAPYWSRYFFAYLDYNDPSTFRLRPADLLNAAAQRAYAAILKRQHTDTGLAFRGM
ncbi:MAG TPA: hypothetical protein VMH26_01690 [Burkholderiales bacterium]|nr:hypothetical protein [Burkholderiales bacterium]